MTHWVEIEFDCLPLRSIGRVDIPLDASPVYRAHCERVKQALERHGAHNTYYLHRARCVFHVLNHPTLGRIEFNFEGTLFTDPEDRRTLGCDLTVALAGETCDWISQGAVDWFAESVRRAVVIEFDRYIDAGDLAQTKERLELLRRQLDSGEGYWGADL